MKRAVGLLFLIVLLLLPAAGAQALDSRFGSYYLNGQAPAGTDEGVTFRGGFYYGGRHYPGSHRSWRQHSEPSAFTPPGGRPGLITGPRTESEPRHRFIERRPPSPCCCPPCYPVAVPDQE
ncbi:MAG: hypothetical protein AB1896_14015 [Thermodesulfobacteriota bacterium]